MENADSSVGQAGKWLLAQQEVHGDTGTVLEVEGGKWMGGLEVVVELIEAGTRGARTRGGG